MKIILILFKPFKTVICYMLDKHLRQELTTTLLMHHEKLDIEHDRNEAIMLYKIKEQLRRQPVVEYSHGARSTQSALISIDAPNSGHAKTVPETRNIEFEKQEQLNKFHI